MNNSLSLSIYIYIYIYIYIDMLAAAAASRSAAKIGTFRGSRSIITYNTLQHSITSYGVI